MWQAERGSRQRDGKFSRLCSPQARNVCRSMSVNRRCSAVPLPPGTFWPKTGAETADGRESTLIGGWWARRIPTGYSQGKVSISIVTRGKKRRGLSGAACDGPLKPHASPLTRSVRTTFAAAVLVPGGLLSRFRRPRVGGRRVGRWRTRGGGRLPAGFFPVGGRAGLGLAAV